MTKFQRFGRIITGIVLVLLSVLLWVDFEIGYIICVLTIGLSLVLYGLRQLIYYFKMARFMVGGKKVLYFGVIALDFGVFSFSMLNASQFFIILYLFLTFALTGVASVLRGFELKKNNAPGWLWWLLSGVINILIVLISIVFIRSQSVLVIIFSISLFYSAVLRIVSAFRKTAVVYIQ